MIIEQERRKRPRIKRSFRNCLGCEGCIEKGLAACIHEWFIIREELYPSQNRN